MNLPPTDGALARDESSADDGTRQRVKLARTWAYVLSQTAYLPWPHAELEQRLTVMVDELVEAVTSQPFTDQRAADIGMRLVEWRCTDPASLRRTFDVLGKGLLTLPELGRVEGLAKRVVAVFGALAAAYSDAMRLFTIEQQENLNHALLNVRQHLLTSEARFDQVAASSASGIAITDLDGQFVRTNAALGRILGHSPSELAGLSLFDVVQLERPDLLPQLYQDLLAGPADRLRQVGRLLRKDDGTARVSLTASLLRSEDGVPNQFVTVVEDATELALLQDELLRQSLHDLLTGLPNRQYFMSRLESIMHATGPTVPLTLYHLDLDAFSLVTGGLGLRVGERLLVAVADRLRTIVDGERSMVARFESDEFAILVENPPTTPDVASFVESINEALSEPIYIDDLGVAVSASVGVVHQPTSDLGPLELLAAAEMTLRRAQRGGHRQWELFDPTKDARDRERFRLAVSMPGAWETGELRVVYQPLVRLADEKVVGLQAMLRWDHAEAGVLDHALCAELAERTGLILPLGSWLLRSACEQVAQWRWLGKDISLYVDLTAGQSADHNLVGAVLRTLAESGLEADRLRLAMPVSVLSTSSSVSLPSVSLPSVSVPSVSLSSADNEAAANLRVMSDIGVATVLRDFGAGPADLASLAELSVGSVRMGSWQAPADAVDSPSTTVLTALVEAVHQAGADVVVDGVEDERQAHWWRSLGVDVAQGTFFAAAALPDDVRDLLRGN